MLPKTSAKEEAAPGSSWTRISRGLHGIEQIDVPPPRVLSHRILIAGRGSISCAKPTRRSTPFERYLPILAMENLKTLKGEICAVAPEDPEFKKLFEVPPPRLIVGDDSTFRVTLVDLTSGKVPSANLTTQNSLVIWLVHTKQLGDDGCFWESASVAEYLQGSSIVAVCNLGEASLAMDALEDIFQTGDSIGNWMEDLEEESSFLHLPDGGRLPIRLSGALRGAAWLKEHRKQLTDGTADLVLIFSQKRFVFCHIQDGMTERTSFNCQNDLLPAANLIELCVKESKEESPA